MMLVLDRFVRLNLGNAFEEVSNSSEIFIEGRLFIRILFSLLMLNWLLRSILLKWIVLSRIALRTSWASSLALGTRWTSWASLLALGTKWTSWLTLWSTVSSDTKVVSMSTVLRVLIMDIFLGSLIISRLNFKVLLNIAFAMSIDSLWLFEPWMSRFWAIWSPDICIRLMGFSILRSSDSLWLHKV